VESEYYKNGRRHRTKYKPNYGQNTSHYENEGNTQDGFNSSRNNPAMRPPLKERDANIINNGDGGQQYPLKPAPPQKFYNNGPVAESNI
jgi:hypothetical protein